jgi:cysteine desulfurase
MITSAAEHRSVLDPARRLRRTGWPVTILPVDSKGLVDLDQLASAITPQTKLVSLMWANNEIGTISPLTEIATLCRERGVWLHSDATQAIGKMPVDLPATGVDLLSFSGHKIYGPAGIGALVVRRASGPVRLQPLIEGGGQQGGLRSGTIPLPLIVGLTEALALCEATRVADALRFSALRDQLWHQLRTAIPGIVRHTPYDSREGEAPAEPHARNEVPPADADRQEPRPPMSTEILPHNLNVGIPGLDGDALLVRLRESELCVSSGAACSSSNREPSHVLTAIGIPDSLARSSVRFGLGRATTEAEVTQAVAVLAEIVSSLRAAR